ncbi:FecR family protein [Chitinophaga sp. GCM10012297]|uniref:FecR family protein n=1 Tax=Chitinophaga chungangae TaxID=2821488 RepID=A0ABS3YA00_9BACT|nr:FecR domain-containing protein [Chitinophaga chungangae]MBO9151505.1 FecR family protein [Chitinophaga chungangae]
MTTQQRIAVLLKKAADATATAEELQELADLVQQDLTGERSLEMETMLRNDAAPAQPYDEAHWNRLADTILSADRPQPAKVITWRAGAWAAAVMLLLASSLTFWLLRKPASVKEPALAAQPQKDIAPGGNRAVLTLGDGTEISLDSAGSGLLAQQGNAKVIKTGNGELQYNASQDGGHSVFNTIATPRGGQYTITLPDGSRVWLNASSSLRYPTVFNGKGRVVELQGEAYFEVAKQPGQSFVVKVDEMEVKVLGTHFNIMAYDDEPEVKTVLLEGAVEVKKAGVARKLKPGQGASLDRQSGVLELMSGVNTEEAVAWKNGFIQLEGNDIRSAMRQIARWYDVEVVYKGNVPAHFTGIVPRNVPVSQVLKMLELTGEVHFEIGDRQIIVSP